MASDGAVPDRKVVPRREWRVTAGVKAVAKAAARNEVQVPASDSGSESGAGSNGSSESTETASAANKGVSNRDGRNGTERAAGSVARAHEEVFSAMVSGCACDDPVHRNAEESGGDAEICDSVHNRVCNTGSGSGSSC